MLFIFAVQRAAAEMRYFHHLMLLASTKPLSRALISINLEYHHGKKKKRRKKEKNSASRAVSTSCPLSAANCQHLNIGFKSAKIWLGFILIRERYRYIYRITKRP